MGTLKKLSQVLGRIKHAGDLQAVGEPLVVNGVGQPLETGVFFEAGFADFCQGDAELVFEFLIAFTHGVFTDLWLGRAL